MALHELATNAVKYGALSNDDGKVDVSWSESNGELIFRWLEKDGPAVEEPKRKGFGSALIEQATDGHAQLEFAPHGVKCTLTLPLK
jgi:two-component sensor histidine kinase